MTRQPTRCERQFAWLPKNTEYRLNLAYVLQEQKQVDEALSQIHQVLRLDAGNARAHGQLGHLLAGLERPGEALVEFQTVVQLLPTDPDAHYDLGAILYRLGRLEEAKREFQRTLELNPHHKLALDALEPPAQP